jgi:thymidine kinase
MLIRTREPISVNVGPMFGSKTLGLIHTITSLEAVHRRVLVIKPSIDTRFGLDKIQSRTGGSHSAHAVPIDNMDAIADLIAKQPDRIDMLAIDELQFFDPAIADLIVDVSQAGIMVAGAGLHRDYRGNPFPTMERVMPLATDLRLTNALCMHRHNGDRPCGMEAMMTQRLLNGQPDSYLSPTVIIEEVGTAVTYEARCLNHWAVADMPVRRKF